MVPVTNIRLCLCPTKAALDNNKQWSCLHSNKLTKTVGPAVKLCYISNRALESLIASFVFIIVVALVIRFIFSWGFNLIISGKLVVFQYSFAKNFLHLTGGFILQKSTL